MIKVAFFLPNTAVSTIDCSQIDTYNPGIGGSEAICIQVALFLSRSNKTVDVCLLVERKFIAPKGLKCVEIGGLSGAVKYAQQNGYDYFVSDHRFLSTQLLVLYPTLRFIAWANCFIKSELWDKYDKLHNLRRIVCVGDAEADRFKGHPLSQKVDVIYPVVPSSILNEFPQLKPLPERSHSVVYAGCLAPYKGFEYLAKSWTKVVSAVPDAHLYVIGNGQLYSRNVGLGEKGLAIEAFENKIVSFLYDEVGNPLPSVHFLGILGKEKYKVFSQCKVGVPNPGGETETFCITAVEMQMMGCMVTTIRKDGFLNSVANQDNLYGSVDDLGDYIIRLLLKQDEEDNKIQTFISNFSPEMTVCRWVSLFERDMAKGITPKERISMLTSYLIAQTLVLYAQIEAKIAAFRVQLAIRSRIRTLLTRVSF